jgi:hypothetical protein
VGSSEDVFFFGLLCARVYVYRVVEDFGILRIHSTDQQKNLQTLFCCNDKSELDICVYSSSGLKLLSRIHVKTHTQIDPVTDRRKKNVN